MKKVLIIDNDGLLAEDLLRAFKVLNFSVKSADTGFEGLAMLDNEYFDIVIIDLYALGFHGEEVAKYIHLKRSNKNPVVIGLSDKPNLISNNEFDRAFVSPLSINDLMELLKYCSSTRNIAMKRSEVGLSPWFI